MSKNVFLRIFCSLKRENRGIEYVAKAFGLEYLNLVRDELVKSYIVQSRHYRSKRGFSTYVVQIL